LERRRITVDTVVAEETHDRLEVSPPSRDQQKETRTGTQTEEGVITFRRVVSNVVAKTSEWVAVFSFSFLFLFFFFLGLHDVLSAVVVVLSHFLFCAAGCGCPVFCLLPLRSHDEARCPRVLSSRKVAEMTSW
jgi:hypothetical protein